MTNGGIYVMATGLEFPADFDGEAETPELWDAFVDFLIEEYGDDVDLEEAHVRTDFFATHGGEKSSMGAAADFISKNREVPEP